MKSDSLCLSIHRENDYWFYIKCTYCVVDSCLAAQLKRNFGCRCYTVVAVCIRPNNDWPFDGPNRQVMLVRYCVWNQFVADNWTVGFLVLTHLVDQLRPAVVLLQIWIRQDILDHDNLSLQLYCCKHRWVHESVIRGIYKYVQQR